MQRLTDPHTHASPGANNAPRPRVVILSSAFLTDRMLFYSDCLARLSESSDVSVWATAVTNPKFFEQWREVKAHIEVFPEVRPFRMPQTYLRRVNEMVWDYRLATPSRMSVRRHVDDKNLPGKLRAMRTPARWLARAGLQGVVEDSVGRLLLTYTRSEEALRRFAANRPDFVLATGPHRPEEPAVVAAAKRLRIPTVALMTSWDNLSTKKRMLFKYDGYLLWSEQMKKELLEFYPHSRTRPTYVVGAPQYDVFHNPRFAMSRQAYCASQRLDPALPIVLYALGSPNLLAEHHGALYMAEQVARGELGNVQLLVRPHPGFLRSPDLERLRHMSPRIVVQETGRPHIVGSTRSQDENEISDWVNTFRHAAVLVNLSSTVTVDAAFCDKPVVNLDYDPEPGRPRQSLVKDINHVWDHFRPLAESGGVWLVDSPEEKIRATRAYLENPHLHREKRRWIAEYVCGFTDGQNGRRLADALADFAKQHVEPGKVPRTRIARS